ncbi:serine hydrolase domain-containing protein [Curtobacterium sp. RRHDQ10]|uniref:serine hydrolase domain-containing protein n=1 Tax=Curtobacterium phyllosphaerae TaxID=3413379 RepID=UPI003BF3DE99
MDVDGTVRYDGSRGTDHSPHALREWGSVTKSLTAAAVEEAARQGILDPDAEVRSIVSRLPTARYSCRELIEHRSGLLRVPWQMLLSPAADPYRRVKGAPLPAKWTRPVGTRGEHLYSNTGYAVLGEVLDTVTGDWLGWTKAHVFGGQEFPSLTLDPADGLRALHRGRDGDLREPWSVGQGPFAAAGGAWSTFEDLVAFARWSVRGPDRPAAWERRGGADFINGETRDAHTSIVRAVSDGRVAVVHSLGIGTRTDMLAVDLLRASSR